ncbi:MAG: enoyl-CoA hydratase/isomerase family protein [Sinobacteraceae bacterium]|nr:enoyl-CoA hydratase/isomerase family protein [Nevskiaceae bacterium]
MTQVLVAQADGVCELRLNRPEKRNALTLAMYGALGEAIRKAEADDSVQVILLSGAGESFTAGNDLADFLSGPALDEQHQALRFIRQLPDIRKVLIAAIQGATVGIGVTLLLHCDLVVAARSTQLSMPFVKLGLVPEAASSLLLPRLVGPQRAAELLLLGQAFDAQQAVTMGLVNRVVEDAELAAAAWQLARSVAAQPAHALHATRSLLKSDVAPVKARIEAEVACFAQLLGSAEFRAAAEAFFARRRPSGAQPPPGADSAG